MNVFIIWDNRKRNTSASYYNLLFEHFVSLAFDKKVRIKLLKRGTMQDLARKYMYIEVDGEEEDIEEFFKFLKNENYEIYKEV